MFDQGHSVFLFRYGQVLERQKGFTSIDSSGLYKNPNASTLEVLKKFMHPIVLLMESCKALESQVKKIRVNYFLKTN